MIDIILFASIAAFIGVRLYNALGRKDFDHSKATATATAPSQENVIDANYVIIKPAEDDAELEEAFGKANAATIRKIRKIDAAFSAKQFLSGAKKAFEIILKAFSAGDKETLKPLLSKDIYSHFSSAIDERIKSKETTETTLVAISSANIKDIAVSNKYAKIAVRIVSEQVNLIKDKQGKIIEGNPSQIDEIDEIWTFGRDLTSNTPNWELIETATA